MFRVCAMWNRPNASNIWTDAITFGLHQRPIPILKILDKVATVVRKRWKKNKKARAREGEKERNEKFTRNSDGQNYNMCFIVCIFIKNTPHLFSEGNQIDNGVCRSRTCHFVSTLVSYLLKHFQFKIEIEIEIEIIE